MLSLFMLGFLFGNMNIAELVMIKTKQAKKLNFRDVARDMLINEANCH